MLVLTDDPCLSSLMTAGMDSSVLNHFTAMINYSIAMRPVNANLFEINAAKGRIKAAQAKGESPKADDLALVEPAVLPPFLSLVKAAQMDSYTMEGVGSSSPRAMDSSMVCSRILGG